MASPKKNAAAEYSEASIRVLKGLEPVKQRPGMYTRTENPLHIVQEVIDNAADEGLGGHASRIDVTLHTDGSMTVDDDGRGIPVGLHPEEGVLVASSIRVLAAPTIFRVVCTGLVCRSPMRYRRALKWWCFVIKSATASFLPAVTWSSRSNPKHCLAVSSAAVRGSP
jgi:hypothetical protein